MAGREHRQTHRTTATCLRQVLLHKLNVLRLYLHHPSAGIHHQEAARAGKNFGWNGTQTNEIRGEERVGLFPSLAISLFVDLTAERGTIGRRVSMRSVQAYLPRLQVGCKLSTDLPARGGIRMDGESTCN